MSKEINNLIVTTGKTLKEFAEGTISHESAAEEYKKLSEKYQKIEEKQKKTGGQNQIQGLCYYNNIENFSLLTGVYSIEKKERKTVSSVTYYGDSDLNARTLKAISNNSEHFFENKTLQISPDSDEEFPYNIYIYPVLDEKLNEIVIACVSSSAFFSEDKFMFLGKLLKNILSIIIFKSDSLEFNYFEDISKEADQYLKNNIDNEHSIKVTLFVFNMLEKIFNHMGITSLLEVSDYIFNTIKDNFKHNAKCFTLSIRDYIILEKINKNDGFKDNKKKLEFRYKNINIPYHTIKLTIDSNESVYNLWDKILTFEDYLATGDIAK